ncbi:hypothetical protein AB9K17_24180, partial [Salmonella enterica subsp. enterica serovar Kentucky]|uniref:hypothetical protein n=1 Tax=Salmonella enterica TaxID=28901 RepID=UPI003F4B836F
IKEEGFNIGKDEILERYTLWMKNVIEPYQQQILGTFEKLLTINNGGTPVKLQVKPNEIFDKDGELDI